MNGRVSFTAQNGARQRKRKFFEVLKDPESNWFTWNILLLESGLFFRFRLTFQLCITYGTHLEYLSILWRHDSIFEAKMEYDSFALAPCFSPVLAVKNLTVEGILQSTTWYVVSIGHWMNASVIKNLQALLVIFENKLKIARALRPVQFERIFKYRD